MKQINLILLLLLFLISSYGRARFTSKITGEKNEELKDSLEVAEQDLNIENLSVGFGDNELADISDLIVFLRPFKQCECVYI